MGGRAPTGNRTTEHLLEGIRPSKETPAYIRVPVSLVCLSPHWGLTSNHGNALLMTPGLTSSLGASARDGSSGSLLDVSIIPGTLGKISPP